MKARRIKPLSWREKARPIIAQVLAENKGKTDKEIKKALRDAYPFGEREYHPYRIWCDEIARQRRTKKRKQSIHPPTQQTLF